MDEFQERYLNHQERKSKSLENFEGDDKVEYPFDEYDSLFKVLKNRRSQRIFNNQPIVSGTLALLMEAIRLSPSSCNRQAIYVKEVDPHKIEQLLVGGKGWIKNANKVLLIFADKLAYKSPNEKSFMPFLDAGFACQSIYLVCEALGLGCCFVNPNIREENKQLFVNAYGDDYFCGAVALGYYDKKSKKPPLRDITKVLRK